jgi:hypothetical protein
MEIARQLVLTCQSTTSALWWSSMCFAKHVVHIGSTTHPPTAERCKSAKSEPTTEPKLSATIFRSRLVYFSYSFFVFAVLALFATIRIAICGDSASSRQQRTHNFHPDNDAHMFFVESSCLLSLLQQLHNPLSNTERDAHPFSYVRPDYTLRNIVKLLRTHRNGLNDAPSIHEQRRTPPHCTTTRTASPAP